MPRWRKCNRPANSRRTRTQTFTELSAELSEQLKASVARGQLDAGVVIYGSRAPFSMVAAARVADGKALEGIFKRLAEYAGNDPGIAGVQLDAEEHASVAIHAVNVGNSPDLQTIGKLFGTKMYFGFAEDTIWLAANVNGTSDLKRAIDGQPAPVQPIQVDAKLASLVRMLAETLEDQTQKTVAAVMTMNLQSAGGDATTMTIGPTEEGELRIVTQSASGILRTFAVALPLVLQLTQQGSGGAPF